MTLSSSSPGASSVMSDTQQQSSPDSSPPPPQNDATSVSGDDHGHVDSALREEEEQARKVNDDAELRRRKAFAQKQQRKKKKKKAETKAEREAKARELDDLLTKSAAFSDILTKKTQALGRVGSSLDGRALGAEGLQMASQPKCLVGGTMRDYQLEGLTWLYEICAQGMSGILADEMGLGKTVQTISLIALLREQEGYLGPHLIVAPLSTLNNWMDEFHKWTPSIPVVMYHGNQREREAIYKSKLTANLKQGRPSNKFPVVCTSYEMVLRDQHNLSKIKWEFIIIDEGHRMKNAESKLFRHLCQFSSATRLLITGTPLQNNLKELWSLLHFLLPNIFTDWEAFESWFDFSDLDDEATTETFIGDKQNQDLVRKMHLILQPLLLRRIKQDVAAHLPKKREYVLFAPMTREQTDLYNALTDADTDARAYLERMAVEKMRACLGAPATEAIEDGKPAKVESSDSETIVKTEVESSDSKDAIDGDSDLSHAKAKANARQSPPKTTKKGKAARKNGPSSPPPSATASPNAFSMMMGRRATRAKTATSVSARINGATEKAEEVSSRMTTPVKEQAEPASRSNKRKAPIADTTPPEAKSSKSSRKSTPASTRTRGRRAVTSSSTSSRYRDADSDDDALSDDAFEERLAREQAAEDERRAKKEQDEAAPRLSPAEAALQNSLDLARKQVAHKKLGNPLAQLRLVCNSPHNFYCPWTADPSAPIDETAMTSSGKMLLLDRLLRRLLATGHKVLIFSQFATQLDLLDDYAQRLRGWPACRIDGSVAHAERAAQISAFNEEGPDSPRLFLLSTRAGGQGINLAAADSVVLFDSDFNPQQDLQAQDRAHRLGQTRPVVVYRLATRDTVEEALLTSADAKRRLEKLVIRKGGFASMHQKMAAAKRAHHTNSSSAPDDADTNADGDDDGNDLDPDTLRRLLLKDGLIYHPEGSSNATAPGSGGEVLSETDLDALCDRSDDAFARAASGHGDADRYRVVETGADAIRMSGVKGA